jgi:hypothetical protein
MHDRDGGYAIENAAQHQVPVHKAENTNEQLNTRGITYVAAGPGFCTGCVALIVGTSV